MSMLCEWFTKASTEPEVPFCGGWGGGQEFFMQQGGGAGNKGHP